MASLHNSLVPSPHGLGTRLTVYIASPQAPHPTWVCTDWWLFSHVCWVSCPLTSRSCACPHHLYWQSPGRACLRHPCWLSPGRACPHHLYWQSLGRACLCHSCWLSPGRACPHYPCWLSPGIVTWSGCDCVGFSCGGSDGAGGGCRNRRMCTHVAATQHYIVDRQQAPSDKGTPHCMYGSQWRLYWFCYSGGARTGVAGYLERQSLYACN